VAAVGITRAIVSMTVSASIAATLIDKVNTHTHTHTHKHICLNVDFILSSVNL